MKLLAIVHKYPPIHNAGAEWMLHAILADFVRRGHEAIVVFDDAPTYRYEGVLVTAAPARHLEAFALEADVVLTHLDRTQAAMRAANAGDRPLVHFVHNDRQVQFHNVRPGPDVLIVPNSEWIDATLSPAYQRLICRPPVFVADYELESDIGAKGFTGNVIRDAITLVNVTGAKGSDVFYELAKRNPARLFLGVLGAYGVPHVSPARRLRNVEILGQTPAITEDVYARTRVLLMPSAYESWGRVAIEAACSGIPTIAHPTPGLKEALGDAGIFAKWKSHRSWQAELERLDDPVAYAEASARSRARAVALDAIARRDLEALEARIVELVEDHRARRGAAYHPQAMSPILSSARAGFRCPVCGAAHCTCKPTMSENAVTIRNAPRPSGEAPKVYRTWQGDFRHSTAGAIAQGLAPDPDDSSLPRPAGRRLRHLVDLEALSRAYTAGSMEARRGFLANLAQIPPKALAGAVSELVAALGVDPGPPAAEAPETELGLEAVLTGRVGDVLEWAGDDPDRLESALTAEEAGRARPSLVKALAARLDT